MRSFGKKRSTATLTLYIVVDRFLKVFFFLDLFLDHALSPDQLFIGGVNFFTFLGLEGFLKNALRAEANSYIKSCG